MAPHPDDLLALLAELDPEGEQGLGDLLGSLALAAGPLAAPPPHLRRELLGHLDGSAPHAGLARRLASLFHLGEAAAAGLLASLDQPGRWRPLFPGVARLIAQPGEALSAAAGKVSASFLRVDPGGEFPYHRHLGAESLLVIEGGLVTEGGLADGESSDPGDFLENGPGTAHAFRATGEGCLAAVLLFEGIQLAPRPS